VGPFGTNFRGLQGKLLNRLDNVVGGRSFRPTDLGKILNDKLMLQEVGKVWRRFLPHNLRGEGVQKKY